MLAMNEEKLKKNTDCVYFLASPLTCKKGNDCEFRHSETARLNPRDCWFWLTGKCTKYHCTFRHPPLDNILAATLPAGKNRVPCFYFGQGYCVKGSKCIFMHGLPPAVSKSMALASNTTMPSQKLPKPNDGMDYTEKSIERIGGVASKLLLKSKSETQVTQTECRALNDDAKISSSKTSLSLELQVDKVTDACSRMPAIPTRSGSHDSASGSNKPKQAITIFYGGPNQVYPCAEVNLPSEDGNYAFSGRNRFTEDQSGVNQLQRVDTSRTEVYNQNESENLHKETSFDVVVDAARTDQATYVEDTDSLPLSDVPMDQEMVLKKENYQTFYNEDLRHHILQGRREGRILMLEDDSCQRRHRVFFRNGLQQHHRHQYDVPCSYQEGWIRGCNALDRQSFGHPGSRQSTSCYCHGTEFKRGLDHVELWRENYRGRSFNKRLHHQTENFHTENVGIKGFAEANAENFKGLRQHSYFNHMSDHQASLAKRHMYQNAGSTIGIGSHNNRNFDRCEFPRTPDFEGPKPLSVLMEEKRRRFASAKVNDCPKGSRIESEGGFPGRTPDVGNLRHCESFRTPDSEGPKPSTLLVKEKHNGIANGDGCEVEDANTSRMEKEVQFISLEKNAVCAKKNDIVLNGISNLPMVPLHGTVEGSGPSSKPKPPCLMKMKDTLIYSADTELSLSLCCSREDLKCIVDDCASDSKIGDLQGGCDS